MLKGSCHCGAVQFTCADDFGTITVCHCPDCRKVQGGAVTAAPIETAKLQWLSGQDAVHEYASSPDKRRAFCRQCGTPLYSRRTNQPDVLRLRMGTIDSPTEATPTAHIFVADLPHWAQLDDDLPRYPALEPGR